MALAQISGYDANGMPILAASSQAPTAGGMPASTSYAPTQFNLGMGTNYAGNLQNTLAGLQNSYNNSINWFGTQPNAAGQGSFDAAFYLAQNPDVAKAVQWGAFPSAYEHYNQFGASEGRAPNSGASLLYQGRQTPSMDYGSTLNSFGFNPDFYMQQNPDVAAAVQSGQFANPLQHYLQFGMQEGRAMTPFQATGQTNFFNTVMPNQYRQQSAQGAAPTSWQGMTGSPFAQAYGGMATMPMMSYLQNSPYASLFGFSQPTAQAQQAAPAQPQSFQIAPGQQSTLSSTPGSTTDWMARAARGGRRDDPWRARRQKGAPDQYLVPKLGR